MDSIGDLSLCLRDPRVEAVQRDHSPLQFPFQRGRATFRPSFRSGQSTRSEVSGKATYRELGEHDGIAWGFREFLPLEL